MTDPFLQQLAEIRAEQARQRQHRVAFRWATVTAADRQAAVFDADTDDGVSLSGLAVDRGVQIIPNVGDRVLLTLDGDVPRYDRPSRIYPAALDPASGEVVAAMDETGKVSGQEGHFGSLYVAGQLYVPTVAEDQGRPLGVVEYGGQYANSAGTTTELGVFEVAADLSVGRLYRIETTNLAFSGPAGALGRARIRMSSDGSTPGLTSQVMASVGGTVAAGNDEGSALRRMHTPTLTGRHRFLLTVARTGGTDGSVALTGSDTFPIQMWVEDVGPYRGNNAVPNDASGATTTPKQTYTKRYPAVWSGTYNGANLDTFYGNEMKQGSYGGDFRGMVGFDSALMVSDLTGATVESCIVYLYANHWYYNSGGTAVIGTHSNAARPGTWTGVTQDRWRSGGWPKPGGRRIDLGAAVGDEFKSGAAKGVALGPAPSTDLAFYGRFNGDGMANEPYVEIRYSK